MGLWRVLFSLYFKHDKIYKNSQDQLMKHYFTIQKEAIFKNVEVLIYVFDVEKEGAELEVKNPSRKQILNFFFL